MLFGSPAWSVAYGILWLVIGVEYLAGWMCGRGDPWHQRFAVLGLVDLIVWSLYMATLGLEWSFPGTPLRLTITLSGYALLAFLLCGKPLWDSLLPVKGVYARRMVAALVLLALLGIGPAFLVLENQGATGYWPDWTPWWGWAILAGLPFYFRALWEVLVRGWNPKTVTTERAPQP